MLTVYGIETDSLTFLFIFYLMLQQCLPFTVLKLVLVENGHYLFCTLQQCLPFTVLKRNICTVCIQFHNVATVLTVYGIETHINLVVVIDF